MGAAISYRNDSTAVANETWKFVQAKSEEQADDEQVLEIRDEEARMKVMPPLALAPLVQEDDMRDEQMEPEPAIDLAQQRYPYVRTTALFSTLQTLKGAARPIATASAPPQLP